MEDELPDNDPSIDVLITELQTHGEIENLLGAGLSVEQVATYMIFRAELVDLLFRSVTAAEDGGPHAAEPLIELVNALQQESLNASDLDQLSARYPTATELADGCAEVIRLLQSMEASVRGEGPAERGEYLAICADARRTLPASLLLTEIVTQLSDMRAGSGLWRHSS